MNNEIEKVINVIGITPLTCSGIIRYIGKHFESDNISILNVALIDNLTPDIIFLFGKCSGIIAKVGSICCHGANIVRELNIPCIILSKSSIEIQEDTFVSFDGISGKLFLYTKD